MQDFAMLASTSNPGAPFGAASSRPTGRAIDHPGAPFVAVSSRRVGRTLPVLAATLALILLSGCRQDMHNQPKFYPQRGTDFYADGRSARPQLENTVARGQLHTDSYFFTGLTGGKEGDTLPIALTEATMLRGQERYNVYCTPCHSRVGNGAGMIVQRGYRPAGNFHSDRLRAEPLGHFFAVITNGYGAMPDYASQITPEDRWAIAAYVRALQLSQNAKQSDVASGSHPDDLHRIATTAGMPSGFADPWSLPATAIYGTPNNDDNGIPGQPTAAPSAKASKTPANQPANPARTATDAPGSNANKQ